MKMMHKKIDSKTRIVLGSDCMRILQCKPGDEVDISMLFEDDLECHALIIRKAKNVSHVDSFDNEQKRLSNKKKKNK